jgi:hypothetical protein
MPWMSRVRVGAHQPEERLPFLLPLVDRYRRVAAPGFARGNIVPDSGGARDAGPGPYRHVIPDSDATAHHHEIANRNTT